MEKVIKIIFIRLEVLVLIALCYFAASASASASKSINQNDSVPWVPTRSLIAKLESQVKLPNNYPLKNYTRYYYGIEKNKTHILMGVLLHKGESDKVIITEEENAPKILDGGCDVINLKYNVEKNKVLSVFCNGDA